MTTPHTDDALELRPCPPDLIAFKWAETLSAGEQSVLLSSSLKRLQSMIDSRAAVATPRYIVGADALRQEMCDILANGKSPLAEIAALATSERPLDICQHGVRWSVECLSCGLPEYVAATPSKSVATLPVDAEQSILLLAAERVAHTARQFCEELQEDAEGVPPLQLANLNEAIDAWEAYPDARESFDDNQPVLAALASLVEDEHATDHQRRVARLALTAIQNDYYGNKLTEAERDDLRRAIAESEIAGCTLENADIDALVDLFEAWLERRCAATPSLPSAPTENIHERFASMCEEQQLAIGEERSLIEKWATMDKREVWNQAVIKCSEVIAAASPLPAVVAPTEVGISWSALLRVLERLRSKNRNPDNEWYHGWNAAIQCLINDINSRAATPVAPLDNHPAIDVTQQHDFVLVQGCDRCGLRGCELGILQHAWIPPASVVFAESAVAAPEGKQDLISRTALLEELSKSADLCISNAKDESKPEGYRKMMEHFAEAGRQIIETVETFRPDSGIVSRDRQAGRYLPAGLNATPAASAVTMLQLPFICDRCNTQQRANGICANCGSPAISATTSAKGEG